MFVNTQFVFVALTLLAATESVVARERWLERDNRPVWSRFARRRFGQERPAAIDELANIAGCTNGVCATLAGAAITPLLAKQPECSQQDQADAIIDAAQQFPEATKQAMIAAAIKYRQAEKNTPPDFSTNPPTNRNSVFCQKAPKNAELIGLVQAQDPANDPDLFFDPALDATVQRGSQANTAPFGGAAAAPVNNGNNAGNGNTGNGNNNAGNGNNNAGNGNTGNGAGADCPPNVTVTVTAGTAAPTAGNGNGNQNNAGNGNNGNNNGGGNNNNNANNGNAGNNGGIGDFGSCSVPEIEFGAGFDNRKETSFRPVDKASFDHGSAQNIDIITRFMCDQLTNKCNADQTAKDTCQQAAAAASAAAKNTGEQADAFNAVFGITTNFNAIAAIDNQGNVVPGTGAAKRGLRRRRGVGSSL